MFENLKKVYDPESIFIYQMGKVGSSTLEASLPNAIHVHNFYDNDPCPVNMYLHFPGFKRYLKYFPYYLLRRIAFKLRRKTKIITVVRPPHERNVSMFFQNLHSWMVAAYTGYPKGRSDVVISAGRLEGVEVLSKVYDKVFPKNYPLDWFDLELKRLTGIDVYDYSFNKNDGYSIIESGKYEVLVLRSDAIERNLGVVAKFTDVPDFKLVSKNFGERKWYSDCYTNFKTNYVIPEEDLSNYKKSKFFKHFFE